MLACCMSNPMINLMDVSRFPWHVLESKRQVCAEYLCYGFKVLAVRLTRKKYQSMITFDLVLHI